LTEENQFSEIFLVFSSLPFYLLLFTLFLLGCGLLSPDLTWTEISRGKILGFDIENSFYGARAAEYKLSLGGNNI
jgi:hypothetical protein